MTIGKYDEVERVPFDSPEELHNLFFSSGLTSRRVLDDETMKGAIGSPNGNLTERCAMATNNLDGRFETVDLQEVNVVVAQLLILARDLDFIVSLIFEFSQEAT